MITVADASTLLDSDVIDADVSALDEIAERELALVTSMGDDFVVDLVEAVAGLVELSHAEPGVLLDAGFQREDVGIDAGDGRFKPDTPLVVRAGPELAAPRFAADES